MQRGGRESLTAGDIGVAMVSFGGSIGLRAADALNIAIRRRCGANLLTLMGICGSARSLV